MYKCKYLGGGDEIWNTCIWWPHPAEPLMTIINASTPTGQPATNVITKMIKILTRKILFDRDLDNRQIIVIIIIMKKVVARL